MSRNAFDSYYPTKLNPDDNVYELAAKEALKSVSLDLAEFEHAKVALATAGIFAILAIADNVSWIARTLDRSDR